MIAFHKTIKSVIHLMLFLGCNGYFIRPSTGLDHDEGYIYKNSNNSLFEGNGNDGGKQQRKRLKGNNNDHITSYRGLKGKGKGSDGSCIEQNVLIRGEDRLNANFFQSTISTSVPPASMDQEFFNIPLYDDEAYLYNNFELIQIGTLQSQLVYLPPGNGIFECIGYFMFSLGIDDDTSSVTAGDNSNDYPAPGQIAGHFTCNSKFSGGTLSGGLGAYKCATGFYDRATITPDFFQGSGYQIFRLVICGSGSCSE